MRRCWINPIAYRDVILAETSLVAYWRLDDTQPTFRDIRGSFNGTLSGSYTQGTKGGLVGDDDAGLILSGGSGVVPFNAALNPTPTFSAEIWFNVPNGNQAGNYSLLDCRTANGLNGFSIGVTPSTFTVFGVIRSNNTSSFGNTPFSFGVWHHVVMTYDGVNGKLYLDGVLGVPFNPAYTANTTDDTWFGHNRGAVLNFFAGGLDEAAIYNAVLSQAQVTAHYQAGAIPLILVDSAFQPSQSPAQAGNAIVPAGYIEQIGSDSETDTRLLTVGGVVRANIFQFVVPYFTGGWPPDPQLGQPGHTPQRPTGEG